MPSYLEGEVKQMMPLIQELAQCDQSLFYGWRIGSVRIDMAGQAARFLSHIAPIRHGCCVITIQGIQEDSCICQQMQCVVCQPRAKSQKTHKTMSLYPGGQQRRILHTFSREEIQQYLIQSGDDNPIHQGTHPIVPGLCILWHLQQDLAISSLHWKASFHAPVYAGDTVTVVQEAKRWHGYVRTHRVFTIQLVTI